MKPKRAINVGDKVQYRIGANLWDGKVISNHPIFSEVFLVKWADSHSGDYVHRKQITKVIRKKKKEKPVARTFWINEAMIPHMADDLATTDVTEKYPKTKFIRVVEVLKEREEK